MRKNVYGVAAVAAVAVDGRICWARWRRCALAEAVSVVGAVGRARVWADRGVSALVSAVSAIKSPALRPGIVGCGQLFEGEADIRTGNRGACVVVNARFAQC